MRKSAGSFRLGILMFVLHSVLSQTRGGTTDTADDLPALLEEVRAKHDVPALAVGIIRMGDKSQVAVVGVRTRGTDPLATADDLWHIGCIVSPGIFLHDRADVLAMMSALTCAGGFMQSDRAVSGLCC